MNREQIDTALDLLEQAADALQDAITDVDDDQNDPLAMRIYQFLDQLKRNSS